jgi:nucleoside-triphosphatase THEP1
VFREAVLAAVESRKPLIGTIHYGLSDQLINRVRAREDAEILEVTHDNRAKLHKTIVEKVVSFVRSSHA